VKIARRGVGRRLSRDVGLGEVGAEEDWRAIRGSSRLIRAGRGVSESYERATLQRRRTSDDDLVDWTERR
jgi:hypothetical protein